MVAADTPDSPSSAEVEERDGLYVGAVTVVYTPDPARPIGLRFAYEYGPGRQTGVWHLDRLTEAQAAQVHHDLGRVLGRKPQSL